MVVKVLSTSSFDQGSRLSPTKSSLFLLPSHLFPSVRHLGFFGNGLSWDRRVKVICSRARASLKCIQAFGESVRGPDFASSSWRITYMAACLPVSTYGLTFWAPEALEKHFKQAEAV